MRPPTHPPPRIRVLGIVGVEDPSRRACVLSRSKRQLLATLVAAGPLGLSAEATADEIWPNGLPSSWQASLRMAGSRLRNELGGSFVSTTGGWYQLELPVEAVDLWTLSSLDSAALVDREHDLLALLALEPFPNVEVNLTIAAAIHAFEQRRLEILEAVARLGQPFAASQLAPIQALAERRSWDSELHDVVQRLSALASSGAPFRPLPAARPLPDRLVERRAHPLIGRDRLVDHVVERVRTHRSVRIVGPPAAGRTAVLAELAHRLAAAGTTICHAVGSPSAERPLEPLRNALGIEPLDLVAQRPTETAGSLRSRSWSQLLEAVDALSPPVCIVVDDVDGLESQSEDALRFLARVFGERDHTLLLAGQAVDDPAWAAIETVDLEPLTLDDLLELAEALQPTATPTQRHHLAHDVMAATQGLAGASRNLITRADPETMSVHPLSAAGAIPKQVEGQLTADAQRVAAAAAVLEQRIELDSLAHLLQRPAPALVDVVQELLAVDVLTETSQPDVFELCTEFPPDAFTAAHDPDELRQFHRRALDLVIDDPGRRARHTERAHPLLPTEAAARAHLDAARQRLAEGSHREAARSFGAVERLDAGRLGVVDLIDYAVALDRSGSDGARIRRLAFDRAANGNDHVSMLAAATSGLPEAERLDGDPERIGMIRSVAPSALPRPLRLERALALSRQLLLAGRFPDANGALDEATGLVVDIEDEARVWLQASHLAGWVPRRRQDGALEPAGFDRLDDVAHPILRARLLQASAVSAVIAGERDRFERWVAELVDLTDRIGDPLRRWHAGLLHALVHEQRMEFGRADAVADAAEHLGITMGVPGAASARLAQRSRRRVHLGADPTADLERLERMGAERSDLATAGFARALADAGRSDEAVEVARRLVGRRSRFAVAIAGVLAPVIRGADDELRREARAILEPRRGTAIVLGAGVSSLGPAEALLLHLADDEQERAELSREATALAERWGFPLWRSMLTEPDR